ncbi:hypothetical protein Anapl_01728, partial [Anas platyrhynchos]
QGPPVPPALALAELLGAAGEQLQAGKCQYPLHVPHHPSHHITGQTWLLLSTHGCSGPSPLVLAADDFQSPFPGPRRPKTTAGWGQASGSVLHPQQLAGGDTWWCPQAVSGVASTAAFFLCEGLLGQHFDVVPNGVAEPQPGDLFLFPLASGGPGWWGAHAGVYCGNGEIIHLEGTSGTSPTGIVAKHSKSHLLRT